MAREIEVSSSFCFFQYRKTDPNQPEKLDIYFSHINK